MHLEFSRHAVSSMQQTFYINNFNVEELIISVTIIFQKVAVLVCKVLHFLAKPTCQIQIYFKFLELVNGFSRGEPYFWRLQCQIIINLSNRGFVGRIVLRPFKDFTAPVLEAFKTS